MGLRGTDIWKYCWRPGINNSSPGDNIATLIWNVNRLGEKRAILFFGPIICFSGFLWYNTGD